MADAPAPTHGTVNDRGLMFCTECRAWFGVVEHRAHFREVMRFGPDPRPREADEGTPHRGSWTGRRSRR